MQTEWITAAALGLGLSATAGFRVFIPLLAAAIAAKTGVLPLQDSFAWLASWPAIICFGTATVAEISAYYIPVLDNALDAIQAPMAIAAGTLLAVSVFPGDQALFRWAAALLVGGGSAGLIHTGMSLMRLFSTKTTGAIANPVIATGEHMAAVGGSLISLFLPLLAAILALILIAFLLRRFFFGKTDPKT